MCIVSALRVWTLANRLEFASNTLIMALRARLLYDFEGDPSAGELVLTEGEVVTIIRQDLGDGWWEGIAANGASGLFPETYVELLDLGSNPAPVAAAAAPPVASAAIPDIHVDSGAGDENWDDWDDDVEDSGPPAAAAVPAAASAIPVASSDPNNFNLTSPSRRGSTTISRTGTIRKNINRFSSFVKSGGEAFVIGSVSLKIQLKSSDKLAIGLDTLHCPSWQFRGDHYTCAISEPTKKSKYKGIKSFTAYQVSTSRGVASVSRRFKHFDWLHDRLVEKFTMLVVPPLPDKQYSGRYGEEFIEKRREKLEIWLNRVARHPVISQCAVLDHFLTSGDSEKEWKAGKRKAEKDTVVGSAFFLALESVPSLSLENSDQEVENFGRFSRHMDETLLSLKDKLTNHCEKVSGPFKREFQKLGTSLHSLGTCFESDQKQSHSPDLTKAIIHTGQTYSNIALAYEEQPKNDLIPLIDGVKEYVGLLSSFPDIVQVHKGAVGKVQECEKLVEEGKTSDQEVADVKGRTNAVSAVALAEINHFQRERVADFKQLMTHFLKEQIAFHQSIISKLTESLQNYDQVTTEY
ncbi:sorting nexin-33-like [Oscarella lobularis]|uniref:sorting nexin-33-like n=1 Tax=Oscarella lobularis TaxID=121494 RepID=UPI0033139813